MHLAAQRTRSNWAPKISQDFHRSIRLHTGRVQIVKNNWEGQQHPRQFEPCILEHM